MLIHNIDGPMLRGEKTQSALGQLASLPNLHMVASLDHINAPMGEDRCLRAAVSVMVNRSLGAEPSPCVSSVGPVQAEPVQLAVVGVRDLPALHGGNVVRELAPGAADRRSRSVLPDPRAAQLDPQCKVPRTHPPTRLTVTAAR